jgi:DNA polymerase I-like protein with 3'-5' exonuclease and polymerase domains
MKLEWSITNYGGILHIDDYDSMPSGSIASIDIETNGKEVHEDGFRIVCISICDDGRNTYVYFDIRPALLDYLTRVNMIAHDGKSAEIPWLTSYGVTIKQLYFDTKTGYYVYDSARKNYALKPILNDVFNIDYPTYEEMISNKDEIVRSCELNPDLLIIKKKGSVQPKTLTLDKLNKEFVGEYNAADAFWTYKLWTWLRQNLSIAQLNFFETIEMPMTRLIYQMEQKGVRIDAKIIRTLHNKNSKARRAAKKKLFEYTGKSFNINSPKQLLPILQEQGLDVQSTGEDILLPYKTTPIVEQLLLYRQYQKLCSTYTIPLFFSSVKSPDGRIHAHFSQNTITGRLSSSNPVNLQNQPAEVREAFVPQEGYSFINSDWSNIELRLPAHFSGEQGFIEELSKLDGDLHTQTANFLYNCDINSLPEEEYKKKRKVAKTCNFLLTNSGTAHQLSIELECTYQEAQEIFRLYWAAYPTMAEWLRIEKRKARINGGIRTWFGRWVSIPQLKLMCSDTNMCRSRFWKGRSCKNCQIREEAERSAMSIKVQGTAADMCKLAALRLHREYGYIPNLAIHDELNYEEPTGQAELVKQRVKTIMESVVSLRVPLIAETKIIRNWKEAK